MPTGEDQAPPGDVTQILLALSEREAGRSDPPSAAQVEQLQELLARELRRVVVRHPASDRRRHDTTSLVNELFVKLARSGVQWQNRRHFFGAAAIALRRLLVDEARQRAAKRHGGGRLRADMLPDQLQEVSTNPADMLALSETIEKLRQRDDRMTEVVHLRLFAGLPAETIAELLGVTERTIERDWQAARAWLYRELAGDSDL